jgi:hypothetical protein
VANQAIQVILDNQAFQALAAFLVSVETAGNLASLAYQVSPELLV